jgi:hypothetical protein
MQSQFHGDPLARRKILTLAAGGAGLVSMGAPAIGAPRSEISSDQTSQAAPDFNEDDTTADILVDTLIAWGATHAFGIVGDSAFWGWIAAKAGLETALCAAAAGALLAIPLSWRWSLGSEKIDVPVPPVGAQPVA